MTWSRYTASILAVVVAAITAGCADQPERILLSRPSDDPASLSRRADALGAEGPRIRFFNEFFDYTYPTATYIAGPEAEVLLEVEAGRVVTMNWSATPQPPANLRAFRWSVDIIDLSDYTPRVNEETDIMRWSQPSPDARSVHVGPWTAGEQHRLYVEAEDDLGLKSLGIVRFSVVEGTNDPPTCGGAAATPTTLWPPLHQFVPVSIDVADPEGDAVTIHVTGVTQDEPVRDDAHAALSATGEETPVADWHGRGLRRCADAVIRPDGSLLLRAERSPRGNGRVYVVSFTATDPSGASCDGTVRVNVPHDRRRPSVDNGQHYNSLDCWPRRGPDHGTIAER